MNKMSDQDIFIDKEETEETSSNVNNIPEQIDIKIKFQSNDNTNSCIEVPNIPSSETIAYLKHNLGEILESCYVTSYRLDFIQVVDKNGISLPLQDVGSINDYTELSSLLAPNADVLEFSLVLESYDLKKIQLHVKKLKDIINDPPTISAKNLKSLENPTVNKDSTASEEKADTLIPKLEEYLKPIEINDFYNQTIYRVGNADIITKKTTSGIDKPLSDIIKSVFASGWNPPLPARKLQGDLLYLEVLTSSEGTFHVTCNAKGFYINRSNRTHFDPTPATNHCFAHELFETLMLNSPTLQSAWVNITTRLNEASKDNLQDENEDASTVLDNLAWIYSTGRRLETSVQSFQWNAAKNPMTSDHTYDMYRTQQELSSLYGVEELGPNREWNDEIQTIRSLPTATADDRIMKAKLECKIISEFTTACKIAAMAIVDGLIAPISIADPVQGQLYLYNGIFFSKTEDSKDTFGICCGEEAYRKVAARELQNQRVLRSLDIEGLNLTLITTVDFKGERFVGQSIIPGIFSQAENMARLMYGILEADKIVTVKNSSFKIMKEISDKLNIPVRNLKLSPFVKDTSAATEESKVSLQQIVSGKNIPIPVIDASINVDNVDLEQISPQIKVDEIDNIVDSNSISTPHCGPIEGKLLHGSDGRVYALEMMRLTPRDANYVLGDKGSNKIDESLLNEMDQNLFVSYILRPELVKSYLHSRVLAQQQKLLTDAFRNEKELEKINSEKQDVAEDDNDNRPSSEESKTTLESIITKHDAELKQISAKSLDLYINPNCFLNFDLDIDSSVSAKDESTARDMAVYLWENVLPRIAKQVREVEIQITDNAAMIRMLHSKGINVRYIGHLATLALHQEQYEYMIYLDGKQVVQPIPYIWNELLVTEMIARAFKHILNRYFSTNHAVYTAPSQTIASMMNYILKFINNTGDIAKNGESIPGEVKNDKTNVVSSNVIPSPVIDSTDRKSKSKKKKSTLKTVGTVFSMGGGLEKDVFSLPDATQSYEIFIKSILDDIKSKYCYTLSPSKNKEIEIDPLLKYSSFDVARLSPHVVLRRICQVCGISIATKAYDLTSTTMSTSNQPIVVANDIISLEPIVRSCEPDVISIDFKDLFDTSLLLYDQGDLNSSFECGQQAFRMITQVAGPYHVQTCRVLDHLSNILLQAGDYQNALGYITKSLSIISQIKSVDCEETLQLYSKLSNCYFVCGNLKSAANHLLVVNYLIQLMSGNKNPMLSSVYTQLALIHDQQGDLDSAIKCYNESMIRINNFIQSIIISVQVADLYYRKGYIEDAMNTQKRAYIILKEVFGDDTNPQLIEIKKTLEVYMRENMLNHENKITSIEKAYDEKLKISNSTITKEKNSKATAVSPVSISENIDINELIKSFENDEKIQKKKNNTKKNKSKK